MATKREIIQDAKTLVNDWQALADSMSEALASADRETLDGYTFVGDICVALDFEGGITASLYLGSVFHLTPSGKHCMPWANSNVDLCPRCHGSGETKKLYVCEYCQGKGKRSDGNLDCHVCKGSGQRHHTCTWCEGLGSREALLDQVWYETLDSMAESHGMYVFSGEGDPTDIFICMSL